MGESPSRPREIRGFTTAELMTAAAVAAVVLAALYAFLAYSARGNLRTLAESGASLELTELLEHLCQDLREARDMRFEELAGGGILVLDSRSEDRGAPHTVRYELTEGGRRIAREELPDGRRRGYDFTGSRGEDDPLMIDVTPDGKTLLVRGLGVVLQVPAPGADTIEPSSEDATSGAGDGRAFPTGGEASGSGGGARANGALAHGGGGTRGDRGPEGRGAVRFGPGLEGTDAPGDGRIDDADVEHEPALAAGPGEYPVAEPTPETGVSVPMEADAHVPAVSYRFIGGGDEAPAFGTNPSASSFGIYESRSNLVDPGSGEPLVFLVGSRGGREPPEPIYVLPDPYQGRTVLGGTPDESWNGIGQGPAFSGDRARPGTAASPGTAGSNGDPGRPPDGPDLMTLDGAIAKAITGDDLARGALLETVRGLRGLPPGEEDAVMTDLAANIDRARTDIEQGLLTGSDVDRTTSINRQIIRNQIRREQGLDATEEEEAARAVEELMSAPGAGDSLAAPPAEEAPPSPPALEEPPPPPPDR